LHLDELKGTVASMRYLAWIAIFSLQLGMFVCEAGVDVCHASSVLSQVQEASSESKGESTVDPTKTCAAHAAHTFLSPVACSHDDPSHVATSIDFLGLLNVPEVFSFIEQPPKALHS